MKLVLGIRKSLRENAAEYYEQAKAMRKKAEGAKKAVAETERELEKARKDELDAAERKAAEVRVKREKKWYEKFRWFTTSGGNLCIAGRDAKQNDLLVSRHMDEADLFLHADIQGAPATILKNVLARMKRGRRRSSLRATRAHGRPELRQLMSTLSQKASSASTRAAGLSAQADSQSLARGSGSGTRGLACA
jgi:hypothetical protein